MMLEVRTTVDALEERAADDLWPLPTFQEMLFKRQENRESPRLCQGANRRSNAPAQRGYSGNS